VINSTATNNNNKGNNMARKHNYLNNKDLLLEIHKSKNTYCVYRDPETDHDFDMILDSVDDVFENSWVNGLSEPHPHAIEVTKRVREIDNGEEVTTYDCLVSNMVIAKEGKAKRLAKRAYDQAVKDGLKVKQAEFAIDPESYTNEDIIFRINEFEHIPWAPPKVSKTKPKRKKIVETNLIVETDEEVVDPKKKHVKTNFPPFYHYRVIAGKAIQVGKSHWKGKYNNGAFDGEFSTKHGNMTPKLASMFMKLCERYATKGNWRGYTYNDEMRGQALLQLSTVGLQFNEAKSQNPFAYYTAIVNNAFTRVLNIEKRNQVIRDDILEANDLTPSYTRQNENDMAILKEREAIFHGRHRAISKK
jgi:hypothetical protein